MKHTYGDVDTDGTAAEAAQDAVMIAGEFLKRDGLLKVDGLEAAKQALAESGHRIAAELRRREREEH